MSREWPAADTTPRPRPFPAVVGEWSLTPVPAGLWASARTSAAPADVRRLPAEPGRLGVVIDARSPDAGTDRLLASLLPAISPPGRGGKLRLILSSSADRYGRTAARRFGLDVITAEDQVTITPYGHGLVRPAAWLSDQGGAGRVGTPPGSGALAQWRQCLPGGECRPAGVLYPSPAWEAALPASPGTDLAGSAMVSRVPAGLALWLPGQPGGLSRAAYAVWPDPERLTIVIDRATPPEAAIDGLGRLLSSLPLADSDGVRLYWPRSGAGSTGRAVRKLAEQSGTDMIVPAADVEDSGGFGAVAHGPLGAAPWLRFTPDGDTQLLGSLYPVPDWERALVGVELHEVADDLVIEQIAAGLCLYRPVPEETGLVVTARSLLPDPQRLTIIVGGGLAPGEAAELLPEVLGQLPVAARDVRLVMARAGVGGPASLAQSLADVSGSQILAPLGQWTATPDGRLRVIHPADSRSGARATAWASFAPRPRPAVQPQPEAAPSVAGDDMTNSTVGPGTAGTGPADHGHAAVGPRSAEEGVRLQVSPGWERTPDPEKVAGRPITTRPEQTRRPEDEGPPASTPPGRGSHEETSLAAGPAIEPAERAAPPSAAAGARPVPETPAPAVLSPLTRAHRSSAAERRIYRESAARYQVHAVTVRRMLTQRPGLRATVTADTEDALTTDFAAVLDFLDADPAVLQETLRTGGTGAGGAARHPWAACVVSGLRRLPSFSGPVFTTANRNDRVFHGYAPGQLIVEPAFVFATSAPQIILDGDVEYVIWAETAKRIVVLSPQAGRDEVIFAAGTAFRVLDAVPGAHGSGSARFFLREVVPAAGRSAARPWPGQAGLGRLGERDRSLLDRLGAAAAVRDSLGAEDRLTPHRPREPGPLLGIDQFGRPFQAAGP